jgi:hypothetical protein
MGQDDLVVGEQRRERMGRLGDPPPLHLKVHGLAAPARQGITAHGDHDSHLC